MRSLKVDGNKIALMMCFAMLTLTACQTTKSRGTNASLVTLATCKTLDLDRIYLTGAELAAIPETVKRKIKETHARYKALDCDSVLDKNVGD